MTTCKKIVERCKITEEIIKTIGKQNFWNIYNFSENKRVHT